MRYRFIQLFLVLLVLTFATQYAYGDNVRKFLYAAELGSTKKVKKMLVKGVDVNSRDDAGKTALIHAAKHGFTDIVEILLEGKAKIDLKDNNGNTALIIASRNGHTKTVKALLDAGAEVEAINRDGMSALMLAAKYRKTKTVKALLGEGADINKALIMAAGWQDATGNVKSLLRYGADVNARSADGTTPLMAARRKHNKKIVKLLLKEGATDAGYAGSAYKKERKKEKQEEKKEKGFSRIMDSLFKKETGLTEKEEKDVAAHAQKAEKDSTAKPREREPEAPTVKLEMEPKVALGAEDSQQTAVTSLKEVPGDTLKQMDVPTTKREIIKTVPLHKAEDALVIKPGEKEQDAPGGRQPEAEHKPSKPSRTSLRSGYLNLNSNDIKSIMKKNNIYDSEWNKNGDFYNDYELKVIYGNNVVIDHATGLMWDQGGSEKPENFAGAKKWVKNLNKKGYAGYKDWRLPTVEEASTLLESSRENGDLYIDAVFNKKQKLVWTGDSFGSVCAWYISFKDGNINNSHINVSDYVRPVRSIMLQKVEQEIKQKVKPEIEPEVAGYRKSTAQPPSTETPKSTVNINTDLNMKERKMAALIRSVEKDIAAMLKEKDSKVKPEIDPEATNHQQSTVEQPSTETPRKRLRTSYRSLDDYGIKSIMEKNNFFESGWNKKGDFHNDYELKVIDGNKVVIDHATDLMWHQSGSSNFMEWNKAAQWVSELNKKGYAGHKDWRFPTVEEAASLLEPSMKNGDLYIDAVFNKKQKSTWTGDSYGRDSAWYVNFKYGSVGSSHLSPYDYIRPVRTMK